MSAEHPTVPAPPRSDAPRPVAPPGGGPPTRRGHGSDPDRRRPAPSRPRGTPPPPRSVTAWRVLLGALSVLLLLVTIAVVERVAHRGEVLPGVDVAGLELAGRSEAAARKAVAGRAWALATDPLAVRVDGRVRSIPPADVGARVDVEATVRAARRAGRSRNPLDQIGGVVLRRFRPDRVELTLGVDEARLRRRLEAVAASDTRGMVQGALRFEGTRVVGVEPRAGHGLQVDGAVASIGHALRRGGPGPVDLPTGRVEPAVDADAVHRAARRARTLLSAPVVIEVGAAPAAAGAPRPPPMTLAPEQVAPMLGTRAHRGELRLTVDAARLRSTLGPSLAAIETAPVDAGFAVDGAAVSVVPSKPGRTVDLAPVAGAVARGEHRVTAPVLERQPEHDTVWARGLNITELVSSFTTNYPCCPPRVTNIRRAAATLDGAIVEPGRVFSLNDRLGPRTPEKGYVKAPAIAGDLSYFEDYGGGVSQVSTTLFNATFFGGYEFVSHAAHSLFISRYPMGREATINYPGLDNKFRNDSKSGILIKAWASSTSITVSFYGNKEGRSVRAEGPNILETIEPTTEYVDDPAVPEGEEREIQSPYRGYVVENFRIISRPGQADVRERLVVRYRMRPRRIARAPAPDPAKPAPGTPAPGPGKPGAPGAPGPTPPTTSAPPHPG